MPVTVQVVGAASLAFWGLVETMVPSSQERVTLTAVVSATPLSEKSLLTVKVAELSVLVMVQELLPLAGRLTGAVQPAAV